MKVTLGQLFLLRRELKQEIGVLEQSLNELFAYREDKTPPEDNFNAVFASLMIKRKLLFSYEVAISNANSLPDTVIFNGSSYSLNDSRILKANFMGDLNIYTAVVRQASMYVKREETESIFDNTVTPPMMRPVKYKYKLVADLAAAKQDCLKITKAISNLDALIQKADWTVEIDLPE